MRDWSLIAKVVAPDIPPQHVARSIAPLNGLDEVFRPLAARLTPEMEPAFSFHPDREQT